MFVNSSNYYNNSFPPKFNILLFNQFNCWLTFFVTYVAQAARMIVYLLLYVVLTNKDTFKEAKYFFWKLSLVKKCRWNSYETTQQEAFMWICSHLNLIWWVCEVHVKPPTLLQLPLLLSRICNRVCQYSFNKIVKFRALLLRLF